MINKGILISKLTKKFNDITLHSIVNECFVNGLPIDKEHITRDEKIALTKYSYKVIKHIGGINALESSIENPALSYGQKMFLGDIYHICTEASKEAAKRCADECDCKDPSTKMKDVVDKASFTEAEYRKFASKVDGIGLDEVADIIKDKTLKVIKDEKDQYKKEEELDNELKDALSETKEFSETSNESYMDIVLNKSDPRHHVTVFSKLQEAAMEMMNIVKVGDNGMDVFPIVDKVTFESFVDELKSDNITLDKGLESLDAIAREEVCEIPFDSRAKLATLTSIIVYTVVETLKTMNIFCPSNDSIKHFVNSSSNATKVAITNRDAIMSKAEEQVGELNTKDTTKMKSQDLSDILQELRKTQEYLGQFVMNNTTDSRVTGLIDKIDKKVEDISSILGERNKELNQSPAEEGYFDNYKKRSDLAQFNKIGNLFGKDPNVKDIRLKINPNGITSIIDVECANESGQIVKRSFMNMQYACESDKYIDYLKTTYENSKLKESNKPVAIFANDGTGRKISL